MCTTPPLLRELLREPGDEFEGDYSCALVFLANNTTLYAELHGSEFSIWALPNHLTETAAVEYVEGQKIVADDVSEFEAQAVFDHYVQTYGLANDHTIG